MINNYPDGGLKMVNIEFFNKVLKVTWIKKYLDKNNRDKWKFIFDFRLGKLDCGLPFTGNLNKMDTIKTLKVTDNVLKEILLIWSEINFEQQLTSERQFHEQNLWFNSLVRVNNAPFYCRE